MYTNSETLKLTIFCVLGVSVFLGLILILFICSSKSKSRRITSRSRRKIKKVKNNKYVVDVSTTSINHIGAVEEENDSNSNLSEVNASNYLYNHQLETRLDERRNMVTKSIPLPTVTEEPDEISPNTPQTPHYIRLLFPPRPVTVEPVEIKSTDATRDAAKSPIKSPNIDYITMKYTVPVENDYENIYKHKSSQSPNPSLFSQ